MHQALYRKWRPMDFADVIGQEHITRTLKGQVLSGRLSHAYLFHGTRGTGKTTCARILAKAVNCLSPQKGDPCNRCDACRAINDQTATDIIELDAATYTGVDNMRELRGEAVYSPAILQKRVYIIDEVHMLSLNAFNAFLKILEEPPSHVIFILATTDIQKVPATILSRCQRFDFYRIRREAIANRLLSIAKSEGISLDGGGASLIAHAADGAMRNALSLLEQAAAASSAEGEGGIVLNAEKVAFVLGMVTAGPLFSLAMAVAQGDTAEALDQFGKMYRDGVEPGAVLDRLSCLFRDILICHMESRAAFLGEGYDAAELAVFLPRFSPARLLYSVQTVQKTLADLGKSPNRQISAEMCLAALCRPDFGGEASALAARLDALEKKLATGTFSAEKAPQKPEKPKTPPPAQQAPAPNAEIKPFEQRSELFALLRDTLDLGLLSHLKLCGMVWRDGRLILQTAEPSTFNMVNRPAVLEAVSAALFEILGHSAGASAEHCDGCAEGFNAPPQSGETENDPFASLLRLAQDEPGLVDLQ